ncbi:MAG: hypothetical protein BMS9Abin18_0587 [Zetaproteobacteria bacterium]|nr:MAG: hypothetical protein BMS9Abin18_0587 [Zetaproteobacteria bacterium]
MRTLRFILMAGLLLAAPITSVSAQETNVSSVIIKVDGLSCPFCAYGLEKHLKKLAGVEGVDIDMKNAQVIVRLKSDARVDDAALKTAVKKAGFTARGITRQ